MTSALQLRTSFPEDMSIVEVGFPVIDLADLGDLKYLSSGVADSLRTPPFRINGEQIAMEADVASASRLGHTGFHDWKSHAIQTSYDFRGSVGSPQIAGSENFKEPENNASSRCISREGDVVKVKVEKIEMMESPSPVVPARIFSLPTDLTPLETEDSELLPAIGHRKSPLTSAGVSPFKPIELSDSDNEDLEPRKEGLTVERSEDDTSMSWDFTPLAVTKCEELPDYSVSADKLSEDADGSRAGRDKELKRKFSAVGVENEVESSSLQLLPGSRVAVFPGESSSKKTVNLEQAMPSAGISMRPRESLLKVETINLDDLDDAAMEEYLRDEDEDIDADCIFEDIDGCDENILFPKDELPSWYQCRSVEKPQTSSCDMNLARPFDLSNVESANEPSMTVQHGVVEDPKAIQLHGGVSDTLEALRRFVQASSARGSFAPSQHSPAAAQAAVTRSTKRTQTGSTRKEVLSIGTETARVDERRAVDMTAAMSEAVFCPGEGPEFENAFEQSQAPYPSNNLFEARTDSGAPDEMVLSRANGLASMGLHSVPGVGSQSKAVVGVQPKEEPVYFDGYPNTFGHSVLSASTEWPQSSAMGLVTDNRNGVIGALRAFEEGRAQMLREQAANVDASGKRPPRRDLKVACSMRKRGLWLNEHRPIGACPGVEVGDCFAYRIEMAIVGLHRAVQAGIAVVSAQHSPFKLPVAGSVVLNDNIVYKDDKDMGDKVFYSGQGGLASKKGTYQDQKLERGNLALENSYKLGTPVRFIRRYKTQGSCSGMLYSYDGLYKVIGMQYITGVQNNKVYVFEMNRLPGQPPIRRPTVQHLLYSTLAVSYPVPLKSQPSAMPTSGMFESQIRSAARSACIQGQGSKSTRFVQGAGVSVGPLNDNSLALQNSSQVWPELHEVKSTLYLMPRSSSKSISGQ